jgi:stage V sporulation protein B
LLTVTSIIIASLISPTYCAYFQFANTLARIPLMLPNSIGTTILPAIASAKATKNSDLLDKYISESYRYILIIIIPACVGIALLSKQIIGTIQPYKLEYMYGATTLSILVIGMGFYTIFSISSSIIQGIKNPIIPIYLLVLGAILNIILTYILVPRYGIEGAGIGTTITNIMITIPCVIVLLKYKKHQNSILPYLKMIIASSVMGICLLGLTSQTFIPLYLQTIIGLIMGLIVYFLVLLILKGFTRRDVQLLKRFNNKIKLLSPFFNKIYDLMIKFSSDE